MNAPDTPPPELVALCEELSRDSRGTIEPHLMDGIEWRLRAQPQSGGPFICYLAPEKADWHTYYCFLAGIEEAHRRGIEEGLQLAARRMQEMMLTAVMRHELPTDPWKKPYLTRK